MTMAIYKKSSGVGGAFLDKKEVKDGAACKFISECLPVEREYQGKPQTQHIVKVQVEGDKEPKNVAINRTSINGLVDAFGEDSKNWIAQPLTVHKETTTIGGKRAYILYFVPETYEVGEDDNGYVIIKKKGKPAEGMNAKEFDSYPEYEGEPTI